MRIQLTLKEIAVKIATQGCFWGYEREGSSTQILFQGVSSSWKGNIFSEDVAGRIIYHKECWIDVPDDKPFPEFGGQYKMEEPKLGGNSKVICIDNLRADELCRRVNEKINEIGDENIISIDYMVVEKYKYSAIIRFRLK